jgi:hypothetical protein
VNAPIGKRAAVTAPQPQGFVREELNDDHAGDIEFACHLLARLDHQQPSI